MSGPLFMMPIIKQFMADRKCTMEDLTGPCREQRLVTLRRDLIRKLDQEGFGVYAIARRMKRDHTTIYHHLGRRPSRTPKRTYGAPRS